MDTGRTLPAADGEAAERGGAGGLSLDEVRSLLLRMIGHDLRNPLSAVVTASTLLLRRGGLTDPQLAALGRVAASGQRMATMIEEILDWAQLELGGALTLAPRPTALAEVVAEVMEELGPRFPGRAVAVTEDGPRDARGVWDPERVAQIVRHLATNALTYGNADGVVRVAVRVGAATSTLEVWSAGPTIAPEDLAAALEPPRPNVRRPKRSGALGLGVYLTRALTEAHGGRFAITSTEAEGTRAVVVLPHAPGDG